MSFGSLATNLTPTPQNRTQPIPPSFSWPIAEFSIEKDDRTVVSYQRH
ncbi:MULTISPECIES: hypothetical protein [unclassified Microcoleus]|nr:MULTISPECIES: hypothetical protein [unclassified Microcoleus]